MKAIVTVIGKDKPGIIAEIATSIAESNVNIEDINQTILQGNFTMLMLCNLDGAKLALRDFQDKLVSLGEKIGVSIRVQHEEIFNAMHKI